MRYMLLINIDKSAPPLQKGEEDAILHECGTMDEAIECAGKIPLREGRAIEVWPTWPR